MVVETHGEKVRENRVEQYGLNLFAIAHEKDRHSARLQSGGKAAVGEGSMGGNMQTTMKQKARVEQLGQKFRLQVRRQASLLISAHPEEPLC